MNPNANYTQIQTHPHAYMHVVKNGLRLDVTGSPCMLDGERGGMGISLGPSPPTNTHHVLVSQPSLARLPMFGPESFASSQQANSTNWLCNEVASSGRLDHTYWPMPATRRTTRNPRHSRLSAQQTTKDETRRVQHGACGPRNGLQAEARGSRKPSHSGQSWA